MNDKKVLMFFLGAGISTFVCRNYILKNQQSLITYNIDNIKGFNENQIPNENNQDVFNTSQFHNNENSPYSGLFEQNKIKKE